MRRFDHSGFERSRLHDAAVADDSLENREFDTSAPLAAEAKEYLMNTFHLDYKSADIIIGYRADDSYFPLHPILSTVQSLTASCAMPCAWASWGSSSC